MQFKFGAERSIIRMHARRTSWTRDGDAGKMARTRDSFETRVLEGKTLDAANDPVIAGTRPLRGWDPFEIWRTRVRSMRRKLPREGKETRD